MCRLNARCRNWSISKYLFRSPHYFGIVNWCQNVSIKSILFARIGNRAKSNFYSFFLCMVSATNCHSITHSSTSVFIENLGTSSQYQLIQANVLSTVIISKTAMYFHNTKPRETFLYMWYLHWSSGCFLPAALVFNSWEINSNATFFSLSHPSVHLKIGYRKFQI